MTPLDLPTVIANGGLPGDLTWPTDYGEYAQLSRPLIDALVVAANTIDQPAELAAVLRAKIADIATDMAFVARLALDLDNTRRANGSLAYDASASPLLAFLDTGGGSAAPPMPRIWHHPADTGVTMTAKKTIRRTLTYLRAAAAGADHLDIYNRNYLLGDFLIAQQKPAIDWPPTIFSWRDADDRPVAIAPAVDALARAFASVSEKIIDDARLRSILADLGKTLAAYHLAKAWSDLNILQRAVSRRRCGTALLSGTPKHLGRLTAWLYRREGRPTLRFAHGGERAFYDDYEWGLSELTECDTFFTHSAGEAAAISRRMSDGRVVRLNGESTPTFDSLGSVRHRNIFERAATAPQRSATGTVMYVAGGYLGEELGDFPNRKPPDVLYFDWQIRLLKALRAAGRRVTVKMHPRGILSELRLLEPYCDAIVTGSFDPVTADADVLVFDFAGTAFFDALASRTGVVLADTGVRPFDATTRDDLARRCAIIQATRDERGRFAIDQDNLADAVERAAADNACSEAFFERYFAA